MPQRKEDLQLGGDSNGSEGSGGRTGRIEWKGEEALKHGRKSMPAPSRSVISEADYDHYSWKRRSEGDPLAVAKVAKTINRSQKIIPYFDYHRVHLTIQTSFLLDLTVTESFLQSHPVYDLEDLRKYWIKLVPSISWYRKVGYSKVYLNYFRHGDSSKSEKDHIMMNGVIKMYQEGYTDPIRSSQDGETVFVILTGSVEFRIEGNPTVFKAKTLEQIHIPPGIGYLFRNMSNTCDTILVYALIKSHLHDNGAYKENSDMMDVD